MGARVDSHLKTSRTYGAGGCKRGVRVIKKVEYVLSSGARGLRDKAKPPKGAKGTGKHVGVDRQTRIRENDRAILHARRQLNHRPSGGGPCLHALSGRQRRCAFVGSYDWHAGVGPVNRHNEA